MTPDPHNPAPTRGRRLRARRSRHSARSRGAVIVLALLGAFMFAGMISYVFNTGRHAQLRQQTQNAADATVISGAGYVARSFNTVAMNNVEISRLIAVVQMLDAIPLSVEYTLLDTYANSKSAKLQRSAGLCPVSNQVISEMASSLSALDLSRYGGLFGHVEAVVRQWLESESSVGLNQRSVSLLGQIIDVFNIQIDMLEEMDDFFNHGGYDVREMTFYDSEFGRGELWKAMETLDAVSTATMEQLGELTQITAVEAGRRNMRGDGGETLAVAAPYDHGFIWKRYAFDDFRDPVVRGRLPQWADNEVTNRGPYDAIFGWRSTQRESIEIPNPDYNPGNSQTTDRFRSRWSGGTGGGGRPTITVGSRLLGYATYGTWQWLGDIIRGRIDREGVLEHSQFTTRVNRMGGNKLNYLWPGSARQWVFLDPHWVTSYSQAEDIIDAGTPRVAYTQFIRMRIQQRFLIFPNDRTLLDAIGEHRNYRLLEYTDDWDIIRPRGGHTTVPSLQKSCDHAWDDGAVVGETTEISRAIVRDHPDRDSIVRTLSGRSFYRVVKSDGTIFQPGDDPDDAVSVRFPAVYVTPTVVRFIWAGINVGPEITIRDPNNFASRTDLPAPLDFDHNQMMRPVDGEVGYPGSPFTYLGVAKQPNHAPTWRQLFDTSAYDGHAAVAQASIFNNHSWDLWTQMWHAQLEPVQDYDLWVQMMQSQIGLASGYDGLSSGELQETLEYLQSVQDLAPFMLQH